MDVIEYFDSSQEYIKKRLDSDPELNSDSSQINKIVQDLDRDNIQAQVNQDFNNKDKKTNKTISVEEEGEKMIKHHKNLDKNGIADDLDIPNELDGERGMNTMERNVYDFTDFMINESKKEGKTIMVMTGSPKIDMFMVEPANKRTKTTFALALSEFGYVQGRMNKDCDVLITDDDNSETNKMEYAHKNGIKIVTYASLIKKYQLFK